MGWSASGVVHPFEVAATARLLAMPDLAEVPEAQPVPGRRVTSPEIVAVLGRIGTVFGLAGLRLYTAAAGRHAYRPDTIVVAESDLAELAGDELEAMLAHECGHVLLGHARFGPLIGRIDGQTPLGAALREWSPASELSADRVAAAYTGSADAITRVIFRQAQVVHSVSSAPVRVREIQAWTATNGFARLVADLPSTVDGAAASHRGAPDTGRSHPTAIFRA